MENKPIAKLIIINATDDFNKEMLHTVSNYTALFRLLTDTGYEKSDIINQVPFLEAWSHKNKPSKFLIHIEEDSYGVLVPKIYRDGS